MPSLAELSQAVAEYQSGRMSIDEFEDWFRDNSRGMFGESADILEACLAVEAAFSEMRFGRASEDNFLLELAAAVRSFSEQRVFVYGEPQAGREFEAGVLRRPLFLDAFVVV